MSKISEAEYRQLRIALEKERNNLLKDIVTKLNDIDKSIWDSLTSAEVGDALRAITNIPGMSIDVNINDTLDVRLEEE